MSKVYSVDVKICATAYIKAKSAAEARTKALALKDKCLDVEDGVEGNSEIEISNLRFDDPALPNVSLSPAMTCHGIWPSAKVERADD